MDFLSNEYRLPKDFGGKLLFKRYKPGSRCGKPGQHTKIKSSYADILARVYLIKVPATVFCP